MRMLSRFPGKCSNCGEKFAEGAQIDYSRETRMTLCAKCAPPVVADVPAVVHVTLAGDDAAFKLDGRLGSEGFAAFRAALGACRFRDGANYLAIGRVAAALVALRAAGIAVNVAVDVQDAISASDSARSSAIVAAATRTAAVDAILAARGGSLYGFQVEGVAWLAPRNGALVADDMGLGKTIQALTAIPDGAPVVVICPAVAKSVWQSESAKWRPEMRVTVLAGRGSFRAPAAGEMVCVNYDILPATPEEREAANLSGDAYGLLPGTVVIVDEAHACASSKSTRTKRARALSEAARSSGGRCWVLTATPLKNSPPELWNVLEVAGLAREVFGSWNRFVLAFNGRPGKFGGYEWGEARSDVPDLLQRVMLRREKTTVLKDLPSKTHRVLPAKIDRATMKLCDAAMAEIEAQEGKVENLLAKLATADVEAAKALEVSVERAIAKLAATGLGFRQLSAARAALAKAKIPAMLEVVETYEEQGEPLVVFSAYRAPVDLFDSRPGWATITGDTSNDRRGEIVEAFQAGKLKGVACTIRAGGVAITLTRSSNVLRVDREWNPALNVQAEDRCYRIGQRNAVLVTDLVAEHRLDEMISECIARKEVLISGSVDAGSVTTVAPAAAPVVVDWQAIEEDAARAMREVAEAQKLLATAKSEHARKMAERRVEAARGEARSRVRSAAARRLAEVETEEDAPRRGPANAVEAWAIVGIRALADADPDHAQDENGVGYSKSDGGLGHALAALDDLTDQEWRLAIRLARHYRGQIGDAPDMAA